VSVLQVKLTQIEGEIMQVSHVTFCSSCHTSRIPHHASHIPHHTSHITRHTPHVTRHTLMQEQSMHGQTMAVTRAPIDALAAAKEEIEQVTCDV